jgi:hypothetical protein
MIGAGRAREVQWRSSAKINRQKQTRHVDTIRLAPLLEFTQTKHSQLCIRPLDEIFAHGLGAVFAMVPVRASGRQRHDVAEIVTSIEQQEGNEE